MHERPIHAGSPNTDESERLGVPSSNMANKSRAQLRALKRPSCRSTCPKTARHRARNLCSPESAAAAKLLRLCLCPRCLWSLLSTGPILCARPATPSRLRQINAELLSALLALAFCHKGLSSASTSNDLLATSTSSIVCDLKLQVGHMLARGSETTGSRLN